MFQIIYVFHILGPVFLKVKAPIIFYTTTCYVSLHYILLVVFVKILFFIFIAFTKCNQFYVTSSKYWVRVYVKYTLRKIP